MFCRKKENLDDFSSSIDNSTQNGVELSNKSTVPLNISSELKSVPKSDYIYNGVLHTPSTLELLSDEEKNNLILQLQEDKRKVYEENEQFRQKNFKMYLKLRKLSPSEV